MKRIHPKLNLAVGIAALALLMSGVGCKNQQAPTMANPFLAPNRVPPPSTRALLPGQAQPYYQGDPLPVTQNGAGPQNGAVVQTSAEADMPSADGNLAWASPTGATTVQNAAVAPMSATPVSSPPSPSVVASNEPNVAIPDDGNSLRFAPPTREPELAEPQSFTPSDPTALAASQAPASSPQSPRDIVQAAYTQPVITSSQAPTPSPWLTPQITQSSAAPTNAAPANSYAPQPSATQPIGQPLASNMPPSLPPYYAVPTVPAANTMDVQMREVPSPPMPRIRIPGSDTSVPTVGSADGFRSRTSMR